MTNEWCTAREAAEILHCSSSYIALLAKTGKVRRMPNSAARKKFDPQYFYNTDDLSKYYGKIRGFKVVNGKVYWATPALPPVKRAPVKAAPTPTPVVAIPVVAEPSKSKSNEQRLLEMVAAKTISVEAALSLLEIVKGL